jgi:hypothetical protein
MIEEIVPVFLTHTYHPNTWFPRVARILLSALFISSLILSSRPAPVTAASSIWHVTQSGSATSCTTWLTPCSLQYALTHAASGDQIWVQQDTYKPGSLQTNTFQLISGVAVYGGFLGTESNLTQRSTDATLTILSGDIGTLGQTNDNVYHVVTGTGADASALLDGFTIRDGNAQLVTPVVNLCDFQGGGGMYTCPTNPGSVHSPIPAPTLNNVIFSNNLALNGGGLYNGIGIQTLTNVTFIDNNGSNIEGGAGLYVSHGTIYLTNGRFINNAAHDGGGMLAYLSNISLINVSFTSNTANGTPDGYGGGLNLQQTGGVAMPDGTTNTATLTNVTFANNSAAPNQGYAIASKTDSHPQIFNSIFWDGGLEIFVELNPLPASSATVSYSDVNGGFAGTGNINSDPQFVSAGPTVDVHLRYNSPAIDAGSNAAASGVTGDLDGSARFVDLSQADTGAGTAPIIDMGAYEARPLYVKSDASGANNGSSWANAYPLLQTALAAAVNGPSNEIWVAQGTYSPGANPTDTFGLNSGVAAYGGFAGTESRFSQRASVNPAKTTLNGNGSVRHVVTGNSTGSNAVLNGFTITGGNGGAEDGGGMWNINSSPTLTNLVFINNSAALGGAMINDASSPRLTNIVFSGNTATGGFGGAIKNTSSSNPTLVNVTFSGNQATSGDAIVNFMGSNPVIKNSILWDTRATNHVEIYNNPVGTASSATVAYSDVWQAAGIYSGTGNFNTNPMFVSSTDLRLLIISPLVNMGDNSAIPAGISTDILGNARINNNIVDMGAYEISYLAFFPIIRK